MVIRKKANELT